MGGSQSSVGPFQKMKFNQSIQAGAQKEKIKAACYPCTSQNDCSRTIDGERATVEGCNGAYKFLKIIPPPAGYIPPKKSSGVFQGGGSPKKMVGEKMVTLGPPKKEQRERESGGVATLGPPKKEQRERESGGVATLGPPKKVETTTRLIEVEAAPAVSSTNSGQGSLGGALFFAFLPISSYSSSCILSLCSIYFVVSAASKQ